MTSSDCELIVDDKLLTGISLVTGELSKKVFEIGNRRVQLIDEKSIAKHIETNRIYSNLKLAELNHSDLISGIYEGGLKIWQCTFDLLKFLCDSKDLAFSNRNVLDLGCGHGLLGLYALQCKANVHFHDFNQEVLKLLTIPNVFVNHSSEIRNCRYFSGDWSHFTNSNNANELIRYDFILTSETIYNPDNYDKLAHLFLKYLSPTGKVFLAAKSFYFGVGGCVNDFLDFIGSKKKLIFEKRWKCLNGVRREIIEISLISEKKIC